jgi:hypothetical protein
VFTVAPNVNNATPIGGVPFTFQSGSPAVFDSQAAYDYIQAMVLYFNENYSNPSGTDPFDLNHPVLPGQNNVYGGDSSVTPVSLVGRASGVMLSRVLGRVMLSKSVPVAASAQ